jgi:hypothetical protein
MVIFGSILTTFDCSSIFGGRLGSNEIWLEPKTEPPSGNLASSNLRNALYVEVFKVLKNNCFYSRTTKKSGRDETDSGSPDFVLDLDNLLERLAEDPGYIALLSGKELELLAEMDPDEIINGNVATTVTGRRAFLEFIYCMNLHFQSNFFGMSQPS